MTPSFDICGYAERKRSEESLSCLGFCVPGSLPEGRYYFTENTVDFLKFKFDCL